MSIFHFIRKFQRLGLQLALVVCLEGGMLPACAQNVSPMILDTTFGLNGLAPIPVADASSPASAPLGFVQMPISGGYMMMSVQTVRGNSRVVASRLTDRGATDSAWGDGGTLVYGIPIPAGSSTFTGTAPARVIVALEGSPAIEVVYLVGLYNDSGGRPNLMVARLSANGSLLSFTSSALIGFVGGPASIDAMSPASGEFLYKGHPGLLVAVRGQGTMANTTTMVQVYTPVGSASTEIVDYTTNDVRLSRPNLRINHLVTRSDSTFDAVGTEGGMALYIHYDAKRLAVIQERYFPLSCGTGFGASSASVADGIVRNETSVLLVGRAQCGGDGVRAVLTHIANIESTPSETWSTRVSEALTGTSDLLQACLSCAAVMSDAVPGQVLVVSPSGYLARLDVGSGRMIGRDALLRDQDSASFALLPTTKLGMAQTRPYLTGIAFYYVPPSTGIFGLARTATDRIFADGTER